MEYELRATPEFFISGVFVFPIPVGINIYRRARMSKAIDVLLSQVKFPSTCVVCLSPASKQYLLQKTFSMGRRSYTVKVNVRCVTHILKPQASKGRLKN